MVSSKQYTLSDRSVSSLGLTAQPFSTANYFEHQRLTIHFDAVSSVLCSGQRPVYLLGQHGMGKTAFINQLAQKLTADGLSPFKVSADVSTRGEHLIDELASFHKAPPKADNTDELTHIATHFINLIRANFRPIVLIDDADMLNINVLRLIARLQTQVKSKLKNGFGILFAIDADNIAEIPAKFEEFFPAEESYVVNLLPLTRELARAYLKFQLENAGYKQNKLPMNMRFSALYSACNGVPGVLNAVAVQAIEQRYSIAPGKTRLTPAYAAMLGVFTVVALSAYGIMNYPFDESDSDALPIAASTAEPTMPASIVARDVSPQINSSDAAEATEEVAVVDAQTTETPEAVATEIMSEPVETVEFSQFSEEPASTPAEPVSTNLTSRAATGGQFAVDLTGKDQWISLAPQNAYTLQLAANNSSTNINHFYQRVSKTGMASSIYTTERNGEPWFVVVGGEFPSFSDAQAAIATLPEWLQNAQPWPRKISLVQDAIQQ